MNNRIKEVLKQVRMIELKTKGLVEGLISGTYKSVFKGRGIEFSDIREYTPGDDVRSIDWNVTARLNKPFVKTFIEERDLSVYFLFDKSGSNNFGFKKSKFDKAVEICATLLFSAVKNSDKVGSLLFTDDVEKFIPAKKSKRHALHILRELISYKPKSKKTDLVNVLKHTLNKLKRKSLIFIISDFIDYDNKSNDVLKYMKLLKKKHDVVAINLKDIRELEIPDVGYLELEDEETGELLLVNTSDKEFQKNYKKLVLEYENKDLELFKKSRVDVVTIKEDEGFEKPLMRLFKLREKHMIR